jgi:DNA repair protein RadC
MDADVVEARDEAAACASDEELVASLLGGPAAAAIEGARAALGSLGGLGGLARASPRTLADVAGIGRARAARLRAALELARRVDRAQITGDSLILGDSAKVAAWARARLMALDHEELWMLALDGRSELRGARRVAAGGHHGLAVAPRDVLRAALLEGASAFVLVHNHPSGDPKPSAEDVAFTHRIFESAEVVGVPLLDHVIVGRSGFARIDPG